MNFTQDDLEKLDLDFRILETVDPEGWPSLFDVIVGCGKAGVEAYALRLIRQKAHDLILEQALEQGLVGLDERIIYSEDRDTYHWGSAEGWALNLLPVDERYATGG